MLEDTSRWVTSKALAECLTGRRDNDVKVVVNGIPVPIAAVYYEPEVDQFHIELVDGDDLRQALRP